MFFLRGKKVKKGIKSVKGLPSGVSLAAAHIVKDVLQCARPYSILIRPTVWNFIFWKGRTAEARRTSAENGARLFPDWVRRQTIVCLCTSACLCICAGVRKTWNISWATFVHGGFYFPKRGIRKPVFQSTPCASLTSGIRGMKGIFLFLFT